MTARDPSVRVRVPAPGEDRPPLARVGVIAGAGFLIGIAWPWLAGVQLVPSAPVDEESAVAVAGSASATVAASPSVTAVSAQKNVAAPPERTAEQTIKIGEAIIVSCRDRHGNKQSECDKIDFDPLAKPRILALAGCEAAKGAAKMLSIGFDLDFEKEQVREITHGKSTTFSDSKTQQILDCARKEFASVRLTGLDHEYARYSIFYFAEFIPPGTVTVAEQAEATEESTSQASGLATVTWDSALVRDTPEDGAVKTRLRYGTRVAVTARKGNWYLIKYDAKGNTGWIHKNAIGM